MSTDTLTDKTILLGVCGSVAAYRSADLARELMRRGAKVHVIMTEHAIRFVTPLLFESLTGNAVTIDSFDEPEAGKIAHIELPKKADLFVIAPATAHTIAKLAHGLADDMLSAAFLAYEGSVLIAPAMNPTMYKNPATQANMNSLRERGIKIIEPVSGIVACGDEGKGKLADVADIAEAVDNLLNYKKDMEGLSLLITAGPTFEPLDPVRFIGNPSSGKMGYAIAENAVTRGAKVTLITGPVSLPPPKGATVVSVTTANEMLLAVEKHFDDCNIFLAAAAVGDYKSKELLNTKKKRDGNPWKIELVPNEDIVRKMGIKKEKQLVIGFAAETDDPENNASAKLISKHLDLIAVNDVSKPDRGFAVDTNQLTLIYPDGRKKELPLVSKAETARLLLDSVLEL